MKVKPMVNGIEVKVGQIWADVNGFESVIDEVYEDGSFVDSYSVCYSRDGSSEEGSHYSLSSLVKGVDSDEVEVYSNPIRFKTETTYGATQSPDSFSAKLRQVQATVQPKATFTESEINAKINQVIKEFDWQRVFSVYNALNWTWYTTQGIPTIGDLVVSGIERMKEAVEIAVANQDEGYVSSGGLIGRAYITDGELTVQLEMQVTEASSGY